MKQKLMSLLLCVMMVVSLLPQTALFASAATSGSCGENLTWTLDDDGTLTISGEGAMMSNPWCYNSGYPIQTVVIESGVTTIGDFAFFMCVNLESVTIPDSVTTIGDNAFNCCTNLTSITIPSSVTTIEDFAFGSCARLTNITVDSENENYCDVDGVLFNKGKTTLIQYPSGKTDSSYTVPNSVTTIEVAAFFGCINLTDVNIPDSVTSIGFSTFSRCQSLTGITIGDGITTIGEDAFSECSSLSSVTIGDSVITIGDSAFRYCDSLTSVTIPDNVTTIGAASFQSCNNLTNITFGNSVTTIGDFAFSLCGNLESVTIPDSVTTIGVVAFRGCTGLVNVIIPNSVTTIGYSTFSECSSLSSITIGNSVTTIEENAFGYCEKLTDVYYTGTEAEWNAISIGSNNEDLTSATIHYNIPVVTTVNGAQIRTIGNQGLRFISSIDKTSVDSKRVVEYGTVLIPSADITDISELVIGATLNGHTVAKVVAKNLYEVTDTTITFTAVLTDIKEKNYTREYTARAYAILDDGSIVYAGAGTSRSIYAVAQRGLQDTSASAENKAIFQAIVDAVEKA